MVMVGRNFLGFTLVTADLNGGLRVHGVATIFRDEPFSNSGPKGGRKNDGFESDAR